MTTPVAPPEPEPLADVIRKLSEGIDRLLKSGLNRNAVVVLLRDATGVGKRDIMEVLDALASLSKRYCQKGTAK